MRLEFLFWMHWVTRVHSHCSWSLATFSPPLFYMWFLFSLFLNGYCWHSTWPLITSEPVIFFEIDRSGQPWEPWIKVNSKVTKLLKESYCTLNSKVTFPFQFISGRIRLPSRHQYSIEVSALLFTKVFAHLFRSHCSNRWKRMFLYAHPLSKLRRRANEDLCSVYYAYTSVIYRG